MDQREKEYFAKAESKLRHAAIDEHRDEIVALMKKSGIVDPLGMILDIKGSYGRRMYSAWNLSNGMSDSAAEKKNDDAITFYDGEGRFPVMLMVWTWGAAERLMPITSPTALESLRGLKRIIEPGQAGVIAIGRHGNSYAIVERFGPVADQLENECCSPANRTLSEVSTNGLQMPTKTKPCHPDKHVWVGTTFELRWLEVLCVKCGALGFVFEPTTREVHDTFGHSPYRLMDNSRVMILHDDDEMRPHLRESLDMLCRPAMNREPVPSEIVVQLEYCPEFAWKIWDLLAMVKREISSIADDLERMGIVEEATRIRESLLDHIQAIRWEWIKTAPYIPRGTDWQWVEQSENIPEDMECDPQLLDGLKTILQDAESVRDRAAKGLDILKTKSPDEPLSYEEACRRYTEWAESESLRRGQISACVPTPNSRFSDLWYDTWHLGNGNGMLAKVGPTGRVWPPPHTIKRMGMEAIRMEVNDE